MEIILLERVEKLGSIGDIVNVKPGFARNFLLPRGKALRASEANKKKFEADRARIEAENAKRRDIARSEAKVKALETKVEALLQELKDVVTRHEHRSTALIVKHDMHSMHCTGASLSSCAFDASPPGSSSSRRPLPTSDLSSMEPGPAEPTSAPQDVHTLNYFHASPRSGANENVPAHKPSAGVVVCCAYSRTETHVCRLFCRVPC